MADEYKFLAEYIRGQDADGASQAFGYSPDTWVPVYETTPVEYRFSALDLPQFTAEEVRVSVYLSSWGATGSVRVEVRRGTQVLASQTEQITSVYTDAVGGRPVLLAFYDPGGSTADLRVHLLPNNAYARLHYAMLSAVTTAPVVEASGRANAVSGTSARPLRQRHVLPALGVDAVSATSGHVWVQRPSVPPAPMWFTDGSPLEAWFTDGEPLPDPALV